MSAAVELLVAAQAQLGEGPAWDARHETLYWVDILGQRLHAFHPQDGSTRSWELDDTPGCCVPARAPGLVLTLGRSVARFDPESGACRRFAQVEPDRPGNRFNDGKCDPAGRLLAGTMDRAEREASGSLYSFAPDGSVRVLLSGVRISNGLTWSRDGATLYYIDTPTRQVRAFEYDLATGAIANPRPVVSIPPELGWPDGMTADADGRLWIALWGGSAVTVWDPRDGRLLETFPLPAPHVTSCVFGGPALRDLYITTARQGLSADQLHAHPLSGGLFRLADICQGMPTFSFG